MGFSSRAGCVCDDLQGCRKIIQAQRQGIHGERRPATFMNAHKA